MKPLVPIPGDSPSLGQAGIGIIGFATPYAYQFKGSALARGLLRCIGWQVHFEGFPTLQGIAVVYPHTSNWDAPVMFLAKWACGVPMMFWGKDSLFRMPLLGRWLRWMRRCRANRL